MSIFGNQYDARAAKRQMVLAEAPASVRMGIEAAETAAKRLYDRLGKLTKERRDGTKPIEGVDAAELDAILSEANALTDGLDGCPYILKEDVLAVQYRARQAVSAERNRRYRVRSEASARLNNAQGSLQRLITVMGNGAGAIVEAMETYPLEALLGPCEAVSGSVKPPIVVTAEDAAAMTDKELSDAITESYLRAHDAIGPAMFVDEVSRMVDLLPDVIEAMEAYRDKRIKDKQLSDKSHGILVAERNRRKAEAERIAARTNRPMADRMAELEQLVAQLGGSAS